MFFVVGWALPRRWALWTELVGALVMQVEWWLNDNTCVLTKPERYLRGNSPAPTVKRGISFPASRE